jgi:hypothetical protein
MPESSVVIPISIPIFRTDSSGNYIYSDFAFPRCGMWVSLPFPPQTTKAEDNAHDNVGIFGSLLNNMRFSAAAMWSTVDTYHYTTHYNNRRFLLVSSFTTSTLLPFGCVRNFARTTLHPQGIPFQSLNHVPNALSSSRFLVEYRNVSQT